VTGCPCEVRQASVSPNLLRGMYSTASKSQGVETLAAQVGVVALKIGSADARQAAKRPNSVWHLGIGFMPENAEVQK
jgi:hypothetical protein